MRSIRAIGSIAILWGLAWAPAGALAAVRHLLLGNASLGEAFAKLMFVLVLVTTTIGVIAGSAFGALVLTLARGRTIRSLPLGTLATGAGVVGFVLGAGVEPGYQAAAVFGVLAAASAAGSLVLARRGAITNPNSDVAAT